jgi:hypothetical protein
VKHIRSFAFGAVVLLAVATVSPIAAAQGQEASKGTEVGITDKARNAIIKACQEDFALVGTSALFINNIDDLVGCVDQAGDATGLPDFGLLSPEPVYQCSPVTRSINPPPLDCDTVDDPEETYTANVGATNYFLNKLSDLHGIFVYPSDLKSAKNGQMPIFESEAELGIDIDETFDLSALAL